MTKRRAPQKQIEERPREADRIPIDEPRQYQPAVVADAPRTMPHNLEAERSIFGGVMIENKVFPQVAAILPTPLYFFRDAHRRIWRAMIQLDEQGQPIEIVTLKEQLDKNNDLEECGGPAYIASLVDGVPRSTNVVYYAEIVKDKASLRGLVKACAEIAATALDADRPAPEILRFGEQRIFALSRGHIPSKARPVREGVSRLYKELEFRQANRGRITGVASGFEEIDRHTLGWQPGNLIFIGARPSIGKTTFALNAAIAAAKAGRRILYFSMEMTREELEFRILSQLSGVALTRILHGGLGGNPESPNSDFAKINLAMEEMAELGERLWIDDQSGRTWGDIRSTCRLVQAEIGLDGAVIDYVQLMKGALDRRGATRNEELTDASNNLKETAKELRLAMMVLSQIRRYDPSKPDRRPKSSDLKDCGAFEQDADIVGLLHRAKHGEDGPTEFIIDKMRNGAVGSYVLTLVGDIVTFIDGGVMPAPEPRNVTPRGKKPGKARPPALPMSREDSAEED